MKPGKWLAAAAPSIFALLFAGAGFATCYFIINGLFNHEIKGEAESYTLGRLLENKPEQRRAAASTYYDSDQALGALNDISWAPPSIPTPFVGGAPMPGQQGNAHINSMQFRADREVAMPKPQDTFRIFLTGGSVAYSAGAPSDDRTIAGYLNATLSRQLTPVTGLKYEVFTLANASWASTQERIAIENRLSELQPDMVISLSGNNDVHWGVRGRDILWFRCYADEFFLSLIKVAFQVNGQPAIPDNVPIDPQPVAPSLVAERLLKNVRISTFALSEKKVDYVFVLQPTLAVTNKKLTPREKARVVQQDYFRESYARMANGLAALHGDYYRFIDLSGVFDGAGEQDEIFLDSYHFGDRGNERIAESIFLRLKDRIVGRGSR